MYTERRLSAHLNNCLGTDIAQEVLGRIADLQISTLSNTHHRPNLPYNLWNMNSNTAVILVGFQLGRGCRIPNQQVYLNFYATHTPFMSKYINPRLCVYTYPDVTIATYNECTYVSAAMNRVPWKHKHGTNGTT